jgi:sarcosine oxidase subunit beta
MKNSYDAIIIGCGIIGNCIAFELAKKGWQTLSVDKLGGSGFGSTAASCAIVRAHYSTYEGVAIAYAGFDIWKNWTEYCEIEDPSGMAVYRDKGSLLLKTQGHDWKKVRRHFDAVGVAYEEWDLDQIRERMPIFDLHTYWPVTRPEGDPRFFEPRDKMLEGGIFCPEAGYMSDPKLSTQNVQVAAENKGADFKFNVQVAAVRQANHRTVGIALSDGTKVDSPVVVNVAGPHSFVINRMAGVEATNKIKTRALRHEVAYVPSPPGFDYEQNGFQVGDGDNGIYMRPELGNSILVGSEDPACDPKVWVEDPDRFNRQVTDLQWNAQVYRCARRIPNLPIPNQKRGLVDLYDVSDDWIPIYDKSDLDGYYMAIGTSGNQYKNGPVAGMMMAELIDNVENHNLDHDATPLQFKLPKIGQRIDVGFYSRNRDINPDSSFTVNG